MSKKYNYNYVFVIYDVEEKRCNKIFKICKKFLKHYQKSVFRGDISPSNLLKLKRELKTKINPDYDYVAIIKLLNSNSYEEEQLGLQVYEEEDILI